MTMKIFTGSSNPALAKAVAAQLNMKLGEALVGRFSDGEIMVEIKENVRGQDVFLLQSTSAPTNDHLMEIMIMADALRRASANSITAVMPYFGYARQDRRVRSARVAISAKVVADMLAAVGISRIITVDLHAEQIQGFFYMPVDNVYTSPQLLADLQQQVWKKIAIVSPDVGGAHRARAIAKRLERDTGANVNLAIIDKRRHGKNQTQVMNIIGDVKDHTCWLVDDIVDTAGTLCQAAAALRENGACSVSAYATHPVLSGPAIDNIEQSVLEELVITDSIPMTEVAKACDKIRVLSLAPCLAETLFRVQERHSVSCMFEE
jgi:ribose-phosphate pyrophosphokinase